MQRNVIQPLPVELVNRIAAGEVIERPASVVKELVENSLDAGASDITIEIEDGGRTLIRVTDNGYGIPADELPRAFAPHATSKLKTDSDLFAIQTMGFRGEALASIGAVSHASISSQFTEADGSTPAACHEIRNDCGMVSMVQQVAGNRGTVVEVRDIFCNVPARRKFLKGGSTEYSHVADAIIKCALPNPRVSFRLLHNERKTLDLPAGDAVQRWLAGWPKEFADQYLPVTVQDAELRLFGIVGTPELARPTAKQQHFFLNGRSIRDKYVQHAVREAFRGLIEPGRHPAAVLLLEIPPGDVDVNVHPTKSEVRFKDSGRIHSLVLNSIREVLLGNDLARTAVARSQGDVQPLRDGERQSMRETLAAFFRGDADTSSDDREQNNNDRWGLHGPAGGSSRLGFEPTQATEPSVEPAGATHDDVSDQQSAARAIQLHNSYLVAESEDGLIIIDQHALHERIMYEELLARVRQGPLESQRLLIPPVIDVSAEQLELLESLQALLKKLGVEATAFGPTTVAVHAFPTFLHRLDPEMFVRDLLSRDEQELQKLGDEELLHELLDMMACKAAVKAGESLGPAEIEALLARRDAVSRSSNCPHGRPTTLKMSLKDLEKQFKRTGF